MVDYLTTVSDVKQIADLTNEYSTGEISAYITRIENELMIKYPNMEQYSEFEIETEYDDVYYIHNKNSVFRPYKITNVRKKDTDLDANWVAEPYDDWTLGVFKATVTVPDSIQTGSDAETYRVDWIPIIYNRLATLLTYQRMLIKGIIISNSDPEGGPGAYLQDEIDELKNLLKSKGNLTRSSVYETYDPTEYVSYEQYNTD